MSQSPASDSVFRVSCLAVLKIWQTAILNSFTEPAVQSGDLVVYTALGKTSPDIPTPFSKWPKGVFVAVDAALISAAANAAIKQIAMPHAGFNWTVFSGGVGATLGPVTGVNIIDDNSGNIVLNSPHSNELFPNFSEMC